MDGGHREHFAETYRTFHGRVWSYAARRVGAARADDVTAETFLIAWRKFDHVPAEPGAWLYAVAHKVVLRHLARESQEEHTRSVLAFERIDEVERSEDAEVRRVWAALSHRDREVLALIAWEELKVSDAALVLEISPAVFSVRLYRARKRFERMLTDASAVVEAKPAPLNPIPSERT